MRWKQVRRSLLSPAQSRHRLRRSLSQRRRRYQRRPSHLALVPAVKPTAKPHLVGQISRGNNQRPAWQTFLVIARSARAASSSGFCCATIFNVTGSKMTELPRRPSVRRPSRWPRGVPREERRARAHHAARDVAGRVSRASGGDGSAAALPAPSAARGACGAPPMASARGAAPARVAGRMRHVVVQEEEHELRGRGGSGACCRRRLAPRAAGAGAVRAKWDG